ncbi:MAG: LamG-like jellyroll fold domain-containing protein, partial [Bacteroidota bacterium]
VEGESQSQNMGLSSTDEQELLLTNNAYVECNAFRGIGGSGNRTIEAWIKTEDGSNGEIVSWGTNITGRKWVFRLANGQLRLEVHGGGTVSTSTVDDGEWHHVACVLTGNTLAGIQFYIDGVLDTNSAVGTTAIDTDNTNGPNVRISRGVNNRYLNAEIDEVRIWDTDLSAQTINAWKHLKVDSSHPDYANLQLYYQFNESGNQIADSSVHARDAALIGEEFRLSQEDGVALFKDFVPTQERPNVVFYQGDYITNVTTTVVDRPIPQPQAHFMVERSIQSAAPNVVMNDAIISSSPVRLWSVEEMIFDETTDTLIAINVLAEDSSIVISDLTYFNRFPFYNELVSFVTPYGINLDLGPEGKSWYIDMSDYVSILKGNKRLLMTLGGQWQEDMDLEFLFIVGTPPRDMIQYEQVWQGTNRIGSARINDVLNDVKLAPTTVSLASDASAFKLKSSITGHGAEGEFHQNGGIVFHKISLDQVERFNWFITQECSENPIYPQGGTWIYDRQGWCPGE